MNKLPEINLDALNRHNQEIDLFIRLMQTDYGLNNLTFRIPRTDVCEFLEIRLNDLPGHIREGLSYHIFEYLEAHLKQSVRRQNHIYFKEQEQTLPPYAPERKTFIALSNMFDRRKSNV